MDNSTTCSNLGKNLNLEEIEKCITQIRDSCKNDEIIVYVDGHWFRGKLTEKFGMRFASGNIGLTRITVSIMDLPVFPEVKL